MEKDRRQWLTLDRVDGIGTVKLFAFYKKVKTAYAIIATGESALLRQCEVAKGRVTD